MDQSLLLTAILKNWSRVASLVAKQGAPACESWWDHQGITPLEVARTEKLAKAEELDRTDKQHRKEELCRSIDLLDGVIDLLENTAPSSAEQAGTP